MKFNKAATSLILFCATSAAALAIAMLGIDAMPSAVHELSRTIVLIATVSSSLIVVLHCFWWVCLSVPCASAAFGQSATDSISIRCS
jgi:hypothetical protein